MKPLLIIPLIGCILAAASNDALNKARTEVFREAHAEFVLKHGFNARALTIIVDFFFIVLILYLIVFWWLIILGRILKHFLPR